MANGPLLNPDSAQAAYDQGYLNDDQYNQLMAQNSYAQSPMAQPAAYEQPETVAAQQPALEFSAEEINPAEKVDSPMDPLGLFGEREQKPIKTSDQLLAELDREDSEKQAEANAKRQEQLYQDLEVKKAEYKNRAQQLRAGKKVGGGGMVPETSVPGMSNEQIKKELAPLEKEIESLQGEYSSLTQPQGRAGSIQKASYAQDAVDLQQGEAELPPAQQPYMPGMSGYDMQQDALLNAANAEMELQRNANIALESLQKQRDDMEAKNVLAEQRRAEKQQEELDKLNAAVQEVGSMEVKPGNFWAKRSTGEKIAAAISIMLGGIGQGMMQRGSNAALDVINNAVKEDIAAQKANIANKQNKIAGMRTAYSQMLGKFDDERKTEKATLASAYDKVERRLEIYANNAKSEKARSNALLAIGQIQQKKQQAIAEFMQTQAATYALTTGEVTDDAAYWKLPEKAREQYIFPTTGYYGFVKGSKEEATEFRKEVAGFRGLQSNVNKLLSMSKIDFKDSAEADEVITLLKGMNKNQIVGSGAISEGEWEILNKAVPDPTKLKNLFAKHRLKTMVATIERQLDAKAAAYGVKKVSTERDKSVGFRKR